MLELENGFLHISEKHSRIFTNFTIFGGKFKNYTKPFFERHIEINYFLFCFSEPVIIENFVFIAKHLQVSNEKYYISENLRPIMVLEMTFITP